MSAVSGGTLAEELRVNAISKGLYLETQKLGELFASGPGGKIVWPNVLSKTQNTTVKQPQNNAVETYEQRRRKQKRRSPPTAADYSSH